MNGTVDAARPRRQRGWSIYVPLDTRRLSATTKCLWVFDLWEDVEEAAAAEGWRPGLQAVALRAIRDNLRLQTERYNIELLVAATDFFFRNDAFMEVGR